MVVSYLEFNVPFQHKYGYIIDKLMMVTFKPNPEWVKMNHHDKYMGQNIWLLSRHTYKYLLTYIHTQTHTYTHQTDWSAKIQSLYRYVVAHGCHLSICWKEHVLVLYPATATTMHIRTTLQLFTWFESIINLRTVILFINWLDCIDDGGWSYPHWTSCPQWCWTVGKYRSIISTINNVNRHRRVTTYQVPHKNRCIIRNENEKYCFYLTAFFQDNLGKPAPER